MLERIRAFCLVDFSQIMLQLRLILVGYQIPDHVAFRQAIIAICLVTHRSSGFGR